MSKSTKPIAVKQAVAKKTAQGDESVVANTGAPVLERLVAAFKNLEKIASSSPEAVSALSNYKDAFSDMFVKLFVLARDRKELKTLQDPMEDAWRKVLPEAPIPKIPEKRKDLVIFPQTSFTDVLALIPKYNTSHVDLMTIGRYLEKEIGSTNPKRIKATKYSETLKSVIDSTTVPVLKSLYTTVLQACERRVVDAVTDETVSKAAQARLKEKIESKANPNAAELRAAKTIGKRLDKNGEKSLAKASGVSTPPNAAIATKPSPHAMKLAKSAPPSASTQAKSPVSTSKIQPPKKRKLTQAEYDRLFLKRARESNMRDELEEERSRLLGAKEDAEAKL